MTLTLMSNLRCVLVTRSGASAAISRTRRPRYASGSFSLTVIRPSPGWIRTRAIAFLRRPVPRLNKSANLQVSLRGEGERLRLLCLVPMLGTGVDAESGEHIRTEVFVLQHALHRVGQREGRVDLLRALERAAAKAARVAAVPGVFLAAELGAGDLDLRRVDDHHVIAAVHVRREGRLVLAPKHLGHA